jgi:hypothetical protein
VTGAVVLVADVGTTFLLAILGVVIALTEIGELFNAVTFIVFGAVILGPLLDEVTWQIMLYAVLSLTVVRMLPVALALLGTGARRPTVAFLGWFGPRGLASIVFAVILLDDTKLPHLHTLLLAITVTIAFSVYAHGLTARPLTERYARWWNSRHLCRRPPRCRVGRVAALARCAPRQDRAGVLPRMEGGSGGIAAALRQIQERRERRSCARRMLAARPTQASRERRRRRPHPGERESRRVLQSRVYPLAGCTARRPRRP